MWGDESEAVAPIIWLYQTVDGRKEEVFYPDLSVLIYRMKPIKFHSLVVKLTYSSAVYPSKTATVSFGDLFDR